MVDPGQLIRNLGYGVMTRPLQLGQWFLSRWNPEPEFQNLKGTLETGLQALFVEAEGFGPSPSVPVGSTGPGGGITTPPPSPPLYVKPGNVFTGFSCPPGYHQESHWDAEFAVYAFTCVLNGHHANWSQVPASDEQSIAPPV